MKLNIDANFPGGNVVVENTENNTVFVRQDWSTSSRWWFYWHFRVRGAQGQTWRFQFVDGGVFSSAGPCVNHDIDRGINRGEGWQWMGREAVQDNAFEHTFGADESDVAFAFCPSYVEGDLQTFLEQHPAIECQALCSSEAGRSVEHLSLPSQHGQYSALFTARTHACETMASFVLEGIMKAWLTLPEAAYLRENVDLHVIPFIDKDGVEKGDQGKFREPHDHNLDFTQAPIYATTRALMEQMADQRGRCVFSLDLHCPWIRGGRNDELFFLGLAPSAHAELEKFMALLQTTQRGPLHFEPRSTIMPGEEWYSGEAPTCSRWARGALSPRLGTSLEIPYAVAGGQAVTPETARAFGHDVCRAFALYLQS